MDMLGIAITMVGNLSERRITRLLDENLNGLPAFLIPPHVEKGLNSGLMTAQYTAAALSLGKQDSSASGLRRLHPHISQLRRLRRHGNNGSPESYPNTGKYRIHNSHSTPLHSPSHRHPRARKLGKRTGKAYTIIRKIAPLIRRQTPNKDIENIKQAIRKSALTEKV